MDRSAVGCRAFKSLAQVSSPERPIVNQAACTCVLVHTVRPPSNCSPLTARRVHVSTLSTSIILLKLSQARTSCAALFT